MSEIPFTSTVERTLRLMELLLFHPAGFTSQELQEKLDISRSTLFFLLKTLKELGYVTQVEKRGRYCLGARLEAWRAPQSPLAHDLVQAFYMEAGRQKYSETLALALNSSEGAVILAQSEGSQVIRSVFSPGQVYPQLRAATEVLKAEPSEKVISNGYCLFQGEDSLELALPVCRDGIRPDAALLLSAPFYRWKVEDFCTAHLAELRAMAARLSYQLGSPFYTPYQPRVQSWMQQTTSLGDAEMAAFLQGPWTARLACVRPDGLPHVIPVWQEWDGKKFLIIAWQGSQWAEYVVNNPNVSLTVDEPWLPLRRVVARGRMVPLDKSALDFPLLLERLTQRYLGQLSAVDLTDQVNKAFSLTPEYLRGWQGISAS